MTNFEIKIKQLIEIVTMNINILQKNYKYFYKDEVFKRVLGKYQELLKIIETRNINKIIEFLEELINLLKILLQRNAKSYEINEYLNIVFYIYNLLLEKDFDRSDYLIYEFSNNNLDKLLQNAKEKSRYNL